MILKLGGLAMENIELMYYIETNRTFSLIRKYAWIMKNVFAATPVLKIVRQIF